MVPWKIVTDDPSPNGGYFEANRSSATLTYIVPEDDFESAVYQFLGYSYRQDANLRRVLPERHPRWRHMHAVRVQERGRAFRQKANFPDGAIDEYDAHLLTVYYEALPYPVKSDGDVTTTTEYLRFVKRIPRPTVEIFTQRKGTFKFDTADGAPTDAPVPADIPIRFPVIEFDWTWHFVPRSWLYGLTGGTVPTNIAARIETVNNATFEGFPAKTFRLAAVEFEEVYTPAPDLIFGAIGLGEQPWLRYHVHLKFKYNSAGWHRLPHPNDNQFYRVKTSTDTEIFPTSSFPTIFAAV